MQWRCSAVLVAMIMALFFSFLSYASDNIAGLWKHANTDPIKYLLTQWELKRV